MPSNMASPGISGAPDRVRQRRGRAHHGRGPERLRSRGLRGDAARERSARGARMALRGRPRRTRPLRPALDRSREGRAAPATAPRRGGGRSPADGRHERARRRTPRWRRPLDPPHPDDEAGAPMPVLAIADEGDGRSIALGIDALWTLKFSELGARTAGRGHGALWDGLLGWLMCAIPASSRPRSRSQGGCTAGLPSTLRAQVLRRCQRDERGDHDRGGADRSLDRGAAAPPSRQSASSFGHDPRLRVLPPSPPAGTPRACGSGADERAHGATLRARRAAMNGPTRGRTRIDSRALAAATGGTFAFADDASAIPFPKATVVSAERHVVPLAPPWAWTLFAAFALGIHWIAAAAERAGLDIVGLVLAPRVRPDRCRAAARRVADRARRRGARLAGRSRERVEHKPAPADLIVRSTRARESSPVPWGPGARPPLALHALEDADPGRPRRGGGCGDSPANHSGNGGRAPLDQRPFSRASDEGVRGGERAPGSARCARRSLRGARGRGGRRPRRTCRRAWSVLRGCSTPFRFFWGRSTTRARACGRSSRNCWRGAFATIEAKVGRSLVGKVHDSVPEVRGAIARALGDLGDPRATQALLLQLRDNVVDVSARSACRASGSCGPATPSTRLHLWPWTGALPFRPGGDRRARTNRNSSRRACPRLQRSARETTLAAASIAPLRERRSSPPGRQRSARSRRRSSTRRAPRQRRAPPGSSASFTRVIAVRPSSPRCAEGRSPRRRPFMRSAVQGRATCSRWVLELTGDASPLIRDQALEAAAALLDPAIPDGRAVEPLSAAPPRYAPGAERARVDRAAARAHRRAARAAPVLAGLARAKGPAVRLAAIGRARNARPLPRPRDPRTSSR